VLVYSATGATTAALPLLGALEKGWPGGAVVVEEWKNLDDLRGLVLSGKGDVWAGHLEAFGRAAARGAGVRLVAVTAWKKFYFVSGPFRGPAGGGEGGPGRAGGRGSGDGAGAAGTPDGPGAGGAGAGEPAGGRNGPDGTGERWPQSPGELAELLAAERLPLYAAPQSGPATGILARIAAMGGPSFDARALPMQQVLLELASGRARAALVPEPGASAALARNPSLRIVGSLEDEHARLAGGPGRLPHAGIAADSAFVKEHPGLVRELQEMMVQSAREFAAMPPAEAVGHLPKTLRDAMGEGVLAESLSRDPIRAVNAADAASEIASFLCLAASELCPGGRLDPGFPADFVLENPPPALGWPNTLDGMDTDPGTQGDSR
jgi:NitT/TauT family transport system substrate-binding protein